MRSFCSLITISNIRKCKWYIRDLHGIIVSMLIGIVLLMRKGKIMAISYNGLWKLLIDNNMNKGDLCKKTGLSSSTMAKMTNGESVKLSVLERICKELNCNFADLVDYVDDSKVKKEK